MVVSTMQTGDFPMHRASFGKVLVGASRQDGAGALC
jgi:hypothetical protein